MKALEMLILISYCARGDEWRRSALGGGAVYLDASAGLQAVLPGRHDLFAGCHPIIDDGNAVADLADSKGARFHRAVGLDHIGVVAVRTALQRARWNGHHIRRSTREQADIEELARP